MPNQPKTPARAVRIDDETWEAVKAEAEAREISASDVVREALANRGAAARVREFHQQGHDGYLAAHCVVCEIWWPCPTIEVLDGVWQPDKD